MIFIRSEIYDCGPPIGRVLLQETTTRWHLPTTWIARRVSEGQCNRLSILTQRKDESTDSEQIGSIIITHAVTPLVARRKKKAWLLLCEKESAFYCAKKGRVRHILDFRQCYENVHLLYERYINTKRMSLNLICVILLTKNQAPRRPSHY